MIIVFPRPITCSVAYLEFNQDKQPEEFKIRFQCMFWKAQEYLM